MRMLVVVRWLLLLSGLWKRRLLMVRLLVVCVRVRRLLVL